MAQPIFAGIDPIPFKGPDSDNPLSFRYYDKNRVVRGKRMEEQLRVAVCYWHTFCGTGSDPFGSATFDRPWQADGDGMAMAKMKAEAAFEFFTKLGVPYYCFHDRDVAPEGKTLAESNDLLDRIVEVLAGPAAEDRRQAPVGHGEPLLQSALHGRARPPTPIPRCSPTPPRR